MSRGARRWQPTPTARASTDQGKGKKESDKQTSEGLANDKKRGAVSADSMTLAPNMVGSEKKAE